MKLLIVVGVLVSTSVFAGGIKDPVVGSAVVKKTGTGTYRVIYKSSNPDDVKVSIVDENNKTVFTEKLLNTDGFIRPYNLTELGEGNYTILIEDANGIKKEQVNYRLDKVSDLFNVIKLSEENKYLVTSPEHGHESLSVKIYNQAGEVLYNESTKLTEAFARVYKLEKIVGKVIFEISDSKGSSKVLVF
jgi:hypothetical protein